MLRRRGIIAAIIGIFLALLVCSISAIIGFFTPIGQQLRTECSVGVVGTGASITVRGALAGRACQTIEEDGSGQFFGLSDKPSQPVVCEYARDRQRYIVRDTGTFKLVGNAICDQLRNGASAYSPPRITPTPPGSTGSQGGVPANLTDAATAKSVKDNKQPQAKATEFATGDEVYITYTANNAKKGQYVDLKMFRDGTKIELQDTQTAFEKDATYYGYYSYKPTTKGAYKVELYYNGESSPSQTLNFIVR